jgi:phosphoglycerol geranylgeranyltransferase
MGRQQDEQHLGSSFGPVEVVDSVPEIPVLQEPYSSQHVSVETIAAVDQLFVPAIYNGDQTHFVGKHLQMFTQLSANFEGLLGQSGSMAGVAEKICAVGYVIQNADSRAASTAGVTESLSLKGVRGAALATEVFYDFPLFYLEYSGQFGGTTAVDAAATVLEETYLLYGGGIDSAQKANTVLDSGADAIVVGDCFHENRGAYRQTARVDR